MLWDLNEAKHLYSLEAGDVVNALVFSPNRYWLCAATASCIKIFDLESKWVEQQSRNLTVELTHEFSGQLSTSSSQNVPTPVRSRNRCVFQSPGQLMARHCSAVSPMTLSESGALSRNYFVGLVVYYMTCCTLKVDRCCIHARLLMIRTRYVRGPNPGRSNNLARIRLPFGVKKSYISVASWKLRTRSSYVYLSIPPKSIVMAPVEMLTCNSHMWDTLVLQLSPLSLASATGKTKQGANKLTLRCHKNQSVC